MSQFHTKWAEDKLRAKQERENRQLMRVMAGPVARHEVIAASEAQELKIAGCALGIEALESLLVAAGLIQADSLMARMKELAEQKADQAEAAYAAATASTASTDEIQGGV